LGLFAHILLIDLLKSRHRLVGIERIAGKIESAVLPFFGLIFKLRRSRLRVAGIKRRRFIMLGPLLLGTSSCGGLRRLGIQDGIRRRSLRRCRSGSAAEYQNPCGGDDEVSACIPIEWMRDHRSAPSCVSHLGEPPGGAQALRFAKVKYV
jgi:hypothetical protein